MSSIVAENTALSSCERKDLVGGIAYEATTIPYILLFPLFWIFTASVRLRKRLARGKTIQRYSLLFDGIEPVARVRAGKARWPALDAVYNWKPSLKGIAGLLERLWMNIRNCQAVRNRYRIVSTMILEEIQSRKGRVCILSIASGSAQSVYDAVSRSNRDVEVTCIDGDDTALEYSRLLAKSYNLTNVDWVKGNVLTPNRILRNTGVRPDIIEVVGLFDYLDDRQIKLLVEQMLEVGAPGVTIITAHIHPNAEAELLKEAVDWDMRYRSKEELKAVLDASGLTGADYVTEPHGIHTVARWTST